jgi:hypothetical protein
MKRSYILMVLTSVVMLMQYGCGGDGKVPAKTGFLSDYSNLRAVSDSSLQYVDMQALGRYSKFIVEPVEVDFHGGAKAIEKQTKGRLSQQDIEDLVNYMHDAVVKALSDGYSVVYQPGPGVARIRIALTDITKSSKPMTLIPQANLAGVGIGGASMEAEIVDSVTGQQIAAMIESRSGSRIPFSNLGDWTAAKKAIDQWAGDFKTKVNEAHGR